ncbi:hypothetical protein [Brevundimonas sp.]|uniref:hypothetical protein n=1 Tax=Brevundimonas sp. TaxID=1871086 RepID=UPI0035B0E17B
MTPIRPSSVGIPNPLAQTPGVLTAQGIEARQAFFRAALEAAKAPQAPARAEPMSVTATARPAAKDETRHAERADAPGRPGRLLDIRV